MHDKYIPEGLKKRVSAPVQRHVPRHPRPVVLNILLLPIKRYAQDVEYWSAS